MFGMAPVLCRVCAHLCVQVVRTLFGLSPGMFGCTQAKSEQHPNKVNSNRGTNPVWTGINGIGGWLGLGWRHVWLNSSFIVPEW
jgi:hypothetical protein